MREQAYRARLVGRLGERSADSYVSYCGRVERVLGTSLDDVDLSGSAIEVIGLELVGAGLPRASVRNCLSAVRSYADLMSAPGPAHASLDVDGRAGTQLQQLTSLDLLRLHGRIIDELRGRGVVRTGNGPIGDYAELLFARAYG